MMIVVSGTVWSLPSSRSRGILPIGHRLRNRARASFPSRSSDGPRREFRSHKVLSAPCGKKTPADESREQAPSNLFRFRRFSAPSEAIYRNGSTTSNRRTRDAPSSGFSELISTADAQSALACPAKMAVVEKSAAALGAWSRRLAHGSAASLRVGLPPCKFQRI
jgi:hypothetical protein